MRQVILLSIVWIAFDSIKIRRINQALVYEYFELLGHRFIDVINICFFQHIIEPQ